MTKQISITILRLVLGLVLGGYSLELIMTSLHGRSHHVLVILGVFEFAGAILFLIPRTLRLGGITLLITFGIAAVFHLLHREYSIGQLAVYAAAVWAVIASRATA